MDRAKLLRGSVPAAAIDASGSAAHAGLANLLHTSLGGVIFVSLSPALCTNAATACSAFVSQLIEQGRIIFPKHNLDDLVRDRDPSLELAAAWYESLANVTCERPAVVLMIDGIERFNPAPLNDFLHAVILWARSLRERDTENAVSDVLGMVRAPATLPIIPCITYTAPAVVLPRERTTYGVPMWPAQFLAGSVLEMLDLAHYDLPDKIEFWDRVVCEVCFTLTVLHFAAAFAWSQRFRVYPPQFLAN